MMIDGLKCSQETEGKEEEGRTAWEEKGKGHPASNNFKN